MIEPVPYLYKQLCNNYNKHPNVILLNIAISNYDGFLTLYIPSESNDFSKFPIYASQLASTNKDHLKKHSPHLIVDEISVECKTLNSIIREYKINILHELYTDTEGHDYEILMDLDLNLLNSHPKLIVFEHKHLDGTFTANNENRPKYRELLKKMKEYRYYIHSQDTEDCTLMLQ